MIITLNLQWIFHLSRSACFDGYVSIAKPDSSDCRYKNDWSSTELPIEDILSRSGATKIYLLQGSGHEGLGIDSCTFSDYLYNKESRKLYEVIFYMNFSDKNINYLERNRIYNYLLFQVMFIYLNQ